MDNACGNSGAGGFQAAVPEFVQEAQAQNGQNSDLVFPNWDPSDERITEIRCRQGTRGILVGDPVEPDLIFLCVHLVRLEKTQMCHQQSWLGLERFAWAKNEKGHPIRLLILRARWSAERSCSICMCRQIFSAHVPTTATRKRADHSAS